MGKHIYKLVASNRELAGSFEVRRQVFIEEQGIPKNLEFDGNDGGALHIVVKEGENFIGTARVLILAGNQAKLERMAVLKPFRRRGIGRRILFFLNEELRSRRVQQVVLHAQCEAVAFYRACGFRELGSPFLEAGIEHIQMQRRLD